MRFGDIRKQDPDASYVRFQDLVLNLFYLTRHLHSMEGNRKH
jgi:hypothetical protein